jgi:hypothetical protein
MLSFLFAFIVSAENLFLSAQDVRNLISYRTGYVNQGRSSTSPAGGISITYSLFYNITTSGNGGAVYYIYTSGTTNADNGRWVITDSVFYLVRVNSGQGGALYISAYNGTLSRVCAYQCQCHRNTQAWGQFASLETYGYTSTSYAYGTYANITVSDVVANECAPEKDHNSSLLTRVVLYFNGARTTWPFYGKLFVRNFNVSKCWTNEYTGLVMLHDGHIALFEFCYVFDNHMTLQSANDFIESYGFVNTTFSFCSFIDNIGEPHALFQSTDTGSTKGDLNFYVINSFFTGNKVRLLFERVNWYYYLSKIYVINCLLAGNQITDYTGSVVFQGSGIAFVSFPQSTGTIGDLFLKIYASNYSGAYLNEFDFLPTRSFSLTSHYSQSQKYSRSNFFSE